MVVQLDSVLLIDLADPLKLEILSLVLNLTVEDYTGVRREEVILELPIGVPPKLSQDLLKLAQHSLAGLDWRVAHTLLGVAHYYSLGVGCPPVLRGMVALIVHR